MSPFVSRTDLETRFSEGLAAMLARHQDLGVYILALANAAYDPALWSMLRGALATRHAQHAAAITEALRAGRRLSDPEDDLLVFLKLMAMGFDAVACAEARAAGPWELSFNPVRALRPPRASGARIDGIARSFDPAGFHFNKPFLARERLWEGTLAGHDAQLLYNKFPFAPLHGLLVPEAQREWPQLLTPERFGWAWQVASDACAELPGFGLTYNSLGAYASVNHLHFQTFVRETALPVQRPEFAHNGGEIAYPLSCQVYDDLEAAWFALDDLHALVQPYNLILAQQRMWLLPRAPQGAQTSTPWLPGPAWSEVAGALTVFSREEYIQLRADDIAGALASLQA